MPHFSLLDVKISLMQALDPLLMPFVISPLSTLSFFHLGSKLGCKYTRLTFFLIVVSKSLMQASDLLLMASVILPLSTVSVLNSTSKPACKYAHLTFFSNSCHQIAQESKDQLMLDLKSSMANLINISIR